MTGSELVARLRALDSGAVSDALNGCSLEGVALGLRPLLSGARIAGRVVTVQLGPPTGATPTRHLASAAVDASGRDQIVVIATGGVVDTAAWGGLLSRAAVGRGVKGVIVDGAARDIDEIREMDFQVFARAAVPRTARGRLVETSWGERVTIGDVAVCTEDFVIADSSGVVFVPAAAAPDVIARAEQIAQRESVMADQISRGRGVSEVMAADYESMWRR